MKKKTGRKHRETVEKIIHLILSTGDEELLFLQQEEFTKTAGIAYEQLIEIFKMEQGIDIATFITREICHRAAFILDRDPGISISLLATHLGYENPVILEGAFLDYFLVTPERYRQLRHNGRFYGHCSHGEFK